MKFTAAGDAKETPSQFLIDFAHLCIDAGAHAIVGHGPHLLRPVEMSMKGNKSEQGLPRRAYTPEIFEYYKNMSEPFGTKLTLRDDGIIECQL